MSNRSSTSGSSSGASTTQGSAATDSGSAPRERVARAPRRDRN
jgi:hypothetical protein